MEHFNQIVRLNSKHIRQPIGSNFGRYACYQNERNKTPKKRKKAENQKAARGRNAKQTRPQRAAQS